MKKETIGAGLCLALALPALALAQSKLQLPSGEETYREMQAEQRSGPCERCGVVYRIRSESRQAAGRRDPANAAGANLNAVDGHMVTTPIIGSGSTVQDARKAGAPAAMYVITVRYDDGSFASFEQLDEPSVRKDERVRVVDGRVELRDD